MKINRYPFEVFSAYEKPDPRTSKVNLGAGTIKVNTGDQVADSFIAEGERSNTLMSLGGLLVAKGISIEAVGAAVQAENHSRCRPPLTDDEMGSIVKSLSRYKPNKIHDYRQSKNTEHIPVISSVGVNDRRGFHFMSIDDLFASPKPIEWVIKDILDANSLADLFGDPGSMKTFVATDMGLCVATKKDWHGHPVRKSGPVFYIAGEGFAGLSRRLKAWEIAHKVCLKDAPFFVSDRPAQFLDADSAAEVVAAVDELRGKHGTPVLIIIDTLNRNFGPGNESDTADMTKFIAAIDEHLRCRYQCAVLIVHHTGLTEKHRARGSIALNGALDWEYRLSQEAGGIRKLTNTKVKDHEPPPSISFRPETITLDGWVDPDDGTVMTSCVLHRVDGAVQDKGRPLTGARKIAFDALNAAIAESGVAGTPEMGGDGHEIVHVDRWRAVAYASGITTSTEQEAKKKAFQRAVSDLLTSGWIGTRDDYWWPNRDTGQGRDIVGTCPGTN